MRTRPFLLIGGPLSVLLGLLACFLVPPLFRKPPPRTVWLNADPPNPPAPPAGGGRHFQAVLGQLNLTYQQWLEINRIRRSIRSPQQRHNAILHILTPWQRARLQQLRPANPPASPDTPPPNSV